MTIPANLIHAEVGILLEAVADQMRQRGLCFAAALEDGHSHEEIKQDMWRRLDLEYGGTMSNAWLDRRITDLLAITGEEAINFNEADK